MFLAWFLYWGWCYFDVCLQIWAFSGMHLLLRIYGVGIFFQISVWADAVFAGGWRLARRRERRRRWRSTRWWSRSGEERLELRFSFCTRRRRRSRIPQKSVWIGIRFSLQFSPFSSFLFRIFFPFSLLSMWNLENSCENIRAWVGSVFTLLHVRTWNTCDTYLPWIGWADRLTYMEFVLHLRRLPDKKLCSGFFCHTCKKFQFYVILFF